MENFLELSKNIIKTCNTPLPKMPPQTMVLDSAVYEATDLRSAFAVAQQKINAATAVQLFAEADKDDLADGETLCDLFFVLLASDCDLDLDNDGELSKEEDDYVNQAYNLAADYLLQWGVEPSDVEAFLNDDDEEAAANIQELLRSVLPDGDDACQEDIDSFAFDANDGSTDAVLDDARTAVMDAAYRRRKVIRHGKKVIIRKRISGRVRLNAKQKMAVRKMHRKSHNARANMLRKKSMRKREKLGMNK